MLLALSGAIGIAFGYFLRWIISLGKRGSMELEIKQMRLDAQETGKRIIAEAEREAKEKSETLTNEFKEKERELKTTEERLVRKEEMVDQRQQNVDSENDALKATAEELSKLKEKAEEAIK